MVDKTDNFVRGSTDASVTSSDTTVSVVDASIFPDPTTGRGEYNLVFWDDASGRPDQDDDAEIIRVTGRDTTDDNLTITRGQEGTSASPHPSDSALQLSPTAKTIEDLDNEKADTDRNVEEFSTNGVVDTVPVSQGSGTLTMKTIAGRYDSLESFQTDGTFDASSVDTALVEVIGGGGGGGGTVDNNDTDTVQLGSGGGGGGYARSFVDISADSSISVTVGSGGAEETDGGSSSFGSIATANGGAGGTAADNNNQFSGGTGGTASGDFIIKGQSGEGGATDGSSFSDPIITTSPAGGDSVYGFGGGGRFTDPSFTSSLSGASGEGYGAGGGGAMNVSGSISISESGGQGADGLVLVWY